MKLTKSTVVYGLIALYTVAPLISATIAATVAQQYDCQLDGNKAYPCIVGGRDIGGKLADWFLSGWFLLLTVPTGGMAFLIYAIFFVNRKPAVKNQSKL